MNENYDSLPKDQRIKIGKTKEDEIAQCLIEHYGQDITESDLYDDMRNASDRLRKKNDKIESIQIKDRTGNYPDLIVDRFEPFYGLEHPGTKPGRDYNKPYDIYMCRVTRKKDGKRYIIEVNAQELKEVIAKMDKEFVEWSKDNKIRFCKVFESKLFSGCKYLWHMDAKSGLPKILIYLSEVTFPNRIAYEYKV
jgi:hypothetical protein